MFINSADGRARRQATFSFNPQDGSVSQPETAVVDQIDIGSTPSTEKVKLRNLQLITDSLGQPRGLEPDEGFTLQPNSEGDFVFAPDSEDFTSANAFATAANTVATFERHLQEMTGKTLDWAFDEGQLGVAPHAGGRIEQPFPNAFYTRFSMQGTGDQGNLFFFDFQDPQGKPTSSANSGEVVAHETGHALLDALKPNYFTSHSFEAKAFHESFGDMVATLMSLENDSVLNKVVSQTGGDLSRPSVLSNLGEELGTAAGGIRSSLNSLNYVDPETLPHEAPHSELARDAHSFSRVFTGAFYEVLDKINDGYLAQGEEPVQALRKTGQDGWRLLIGQMENATESSFVTFEELAEAMLQGDMDFNDGRHGEILESVFQSRNLLPGEQEPSAVTDILGLALDMDLDSPLVPMKFSLGEKFGELAGVVVTAQHEMNIFKSDDESLKQAALEREILHMAEHDEIFIPEPGQEVQLADFIRPDGSHFHAYLDRQTNQLKAVPLT